MLMEEDKDHRISKTRCLEGIYTHTVPLIRYTSSGSRAASLEVFRFDPRSSHQLQT